MNALLGVVHYASYPGAASGASGEAMRTLPKLLCDDDLEAVELTWIREPQERREVAAMLRYAGVQVMFSAGPPLLAGRYNLSSIDPEERKQAVAFSRGLVDMALELGACNMLIGSGPDPGPETERHAMAAFTESMGELCQYAAGATSGPLAICLEPFDRDVHWRQLLGPIALSAAAVAEVRSRYANCGLTLDMSHVAQLGEELADAVRLAGPYLVHAHAANCILQAGHALYGDLHPHFGFPEGFYQPGDVDRFVAMLSDNGFFERPCPYGRPVISFEVRPAPGEDADTVYTASKRLLRQALSNHRGDKE